MKGADITATRRMAPIFGTKVSVISCTCVSACRSAMEMPTIMPAASMGEVTRKAVHTPSRTMSLASASFITRASDRHPHDFLIGTRQLVPNSDSWLLRDFRGHHAFHHLLRACLALCPRHGHCLTPAQHVYGVRY